MPAQKRDENAKAKTVMGKNVEGFRLGKQGCVNI